MPPYGEFIFGHEYAGDVVALGPTVDEFQIGDRVVVGRTWAAVAARTAFAGCTPPA
jgi:threonine dehydrogenase-like Zn-dependent dehydrogenase